jgi:hypothetical protein
MRTLLAAILAAAAASVLTAAPAHAEASCGVWLETESDAWAICYQGYGQGRVVIDCGAGGFVHGPWVPADGVTKSHASCGAFYVAESVDAEHRA